MTCTRCGSGEPSRPRREHAERILCEMCAACPPLVDWLHPPDPPDPELLRSAHGLEPNGDRPELVLVVPDAGGHWLDGKPMDPLAVAAEPLPTIPGFPFLHTGNAAVISGPTGGGRSSLVQACAYDAARAGIRVAYLGSEVTEPEFDARAADLASRRGDEISDDLREQLARVTYLNLASTIAHAWEHQRAWVTEVVARFDVVLLDPLSAVASVLDLDFDKSNADFVRFYDRLVQPLAAAGVAVVLLENIGHAIEARARAKGASAKADRPDLTFSCKLRANPVGLVLTVGKVRTVRAAFERGDSWTFDRDTQRVAASGIDRDQGAEPARFRPTVLMERVSRAIEESPGLSRRALRSVKGKHDHKELALDVLIEEAYVEARAEGRWPTHYSLAPFRHENESGPQVAPTGPPSGPSVGGPLAPSLKGQGPPPNAGDPPPVAPEDQDRADALAARYPEAV